MLSPQIASRMQDIYEAESKSAYRDWFGHVISLVERQLGPVDEATKAQLEELCVEAYNKGIDAIRMSQMILGG